MPDKRTLISLEKEVNYSRSPHFKDNLPSDGSHQKIWWICGQGHEWETPVYSRTLLGSNCPVCSRKATPGMDDLATLHPHLVSFWHSGNPLPVNLVKPSSREPAKWIHPTCGHEWEAVVRTMVAKKKIVCKECSTLSLPKNRSPRVRAGKIVVTLYPKFVEETITDNNLSEVSVHSPELFKFRCKENHEWEAKVKTRFKKVNNVIVFKECPECIFKTKPVVSEQEWFTPEIWGHQNLDSPSKVTLGSGKQYWWACKKNHEWQKTVKEYVKHPVCIYCSNKSLLPGFNDLATINPKLAAEWHPVKNGNVTAGNILANSGQTVWWLGECGHEWKAQVGNRHIRQNGCFLCSYSHRTSKIELEIQQYVTSLPVTGIVCNTRTVINPKELDIYIPNKNIAVELNGLYWHSEAAGKDKNYHYNKWLACKEKGIQLLQIWEDDWLYKNGQVRSLLAYKLGVSSSPQVSARKTFVRSITPEQASLFLNQHHIQGYSKGSIRLGLFHGDELVAVMVLQQQQGNILYLSRFATSQTVQGGFSKLLAACQKLHPHSETIYTFSDNTVSDGGLYHNNGFMLDTMVAPDYFYINPVTRMREHKFNYRLERFRKDIDLKFEEGATEKELAVLNNLVRVWDAGKIKWVLNCVNRKNVV